MKFQMRGVALFAVLSTISVSASLPASAQTDYKSEYNRAITGILNNIQGNGAIIASPSQLPDYNFDWVRDSAVTMKTVVELAYDNSTEKNLRNDLLAKIDRWISWELKRQTAATTWLDDEKRFADLGEVKFYVSGGSFQGSWGRPQNDGPALRALTAIKIANHWVDVGRMKDVSNSLYRSELPAHTMIKRDLEYVAAHWHEWSFDLWEEEKGMQFYTLTVQKVALFKGADLAKRLGDNDAASYYANQANAIEEYLGQFIDSNSGTIVYARYQNRYNHINTDLDIAVLLAAIQTFDGNFYAPVANLINTANALMNAFASEYSLNSVRQSPTGTKLGIAMGRYPGDAFSGTDRTGGNPWFLSTLALGEFFCDLSKVTGNQYTDQVQAQFNRVLNHVNKETGSIWEQFNRNTGYQQSARDLTWSYTAYVSAYRACL